MNFECDGFYIDGDWLRWEDIPDEDDDEFTTHAERLEYEARIRWEFPNAELAIVEAFRDLLAVTKNYHWETGLHLNTYGDIGELYGAIKYGIKLHKPYAEGSDGRMGDDFVEIKTISPLSKSDTKGIKMKGNFNKVLLVKVDKEFQVQGKMFDRKNLEKRRSKIELSWEES